MSWFLDTDVIRWVAVICVSVVIAGMLYVVVVRRATPQLLRLTGIAVVVLLLGVAIGVIANMSQPLPPTPGQPPPPAGLQLPPTRAVKWTSGFGAVAALLVLWALAREWMAGRSTRKDRT